MVDCLRAGRNRPQDAESWVQPFDLRAEQRKRIRVVFDQSNGDMSLGHGSAGRNIAMAPGRHGGIICVRHGFSVWRYRLFQAESKEIFSAVAALACFCDDNTIRT